MKAFVLLFEGRFLVHARDPRRVVTPRGLGVRRFEAQEEAAAFGLVGGEIADLPAPAGEVDAGLHSCRRGVRMPASIKRVAGGSKRVMIVSVGA